MVLCSAVSTQAVNPGHRRGHRVLRQHHRSGSGDEDDFNIGRPDEVIKASIDARKTLAAVGAGA